MTENLSQPQVRHTARLDLVEGDPNAQIYRRIEKLKTDIHGFYTEAFSHVVTEPLTSDLLSLPPVVRLSTALEVMMPEFMEILNEAKVSYVTSSLSSPRSKRGVVNRYTSWFLDCFEQLVDVLQMENDKLVALFETTLPKEKRDDRFVFFLRTKRRIEGLRIRMRDIRTALRIDADIHARDQIVQIFGAFRKSFHTRLGTSTGDILKSLDVDTSAHQRLT